MPEREQLVKKIFPRIRKECRERGIEFTEIDLRWGITEEESRTGKTIRICLEEIDRCRPYFIGIIGSRYGWVPGITEIEKDEEMLKEFPWLRDYAASDKSIIEMEFAHGAILRKNDSAFFYEQGNNDSQYSNDKMDSNDKSFQSISSLESLKHTLQSTGVPYRRFTDPEELGEQVFQDILTILDRDFPQKKEMTPLDHERAEHEAYSRNRRQSYVANPEYYEAFAKYVESDGPPLIIWGRSGLGKSALMAYLAHEYQTRNPNAFVVQHFIGAAEGSDPEDVMRQVMMEIKERYQLADTIPTDENALREEFPVWLAKVGGDGQAESTDLRVGRRFQPDTLILLIDALNQLTGIAPEMHWLPDFIPANVRLIVSTTTESLPLAQLRERKWNELELQPLTEQQREAIAQGFLNRFHKSLPLSDLHTLSANPKSSSPLFLRTVLEELRIFGHHTTLHEELEDYLASADERELFQKVLARMERDHGEDAVRNVMTAIWASRHGLSESELMQITGKPRMELSELMIAMEYHLMTREGFHTFFHNYLREAVEMRYMPDEVARKAAHAKIGEYFSTREYGHRRRDEEPWQWTEAGEKERLIGSLADLAMLNLFIQSQRTHELVTHWVHADMDRVAGSYADSYGKLPDNVGNAERQEQLRNIGKILLAASRPMDAQGYLERSLEFTRKIHGIKSFQAAEALEDLAELQYELADFNGAKNSLQEAVSIHEEANSSPLKVAARYSSLASVAYQQQQYEEGLMFCNSALAVLPEGGWDEDTLRADIFTNMSGLYYRQKKLNEAISAAEQAVEAQRNLHGDSDNHTLIAMNNLASILSAAGRYVESEQLFLSLIVTLKMNLGKTHLNVASALKGFALALERANQIPRAKAAIKEALAIFLKHLPSDHPELLSGQLAVGAYEFLEGNFSEAEKIYRQYEPLRATILGFTHPTVLRGRERYIEILLALGKNRRSLHAQIGTGGCFIKTIRIQNRIKTTKMLSSCTAVRNHYNNRDRSPAIGSVHAG